MNRRIEPGLLVVFRYFSAVAIAYFALIISLTFRQEDTLASPYTRWSWFNLLVYIVLFIYLSWTWLRRKLGAYYLPFAFVLATALPAMSNLFDYFLPSGQSLFTMIIRSWVIFPILIVPLVMIAWQYQFKHVLIYVVLATIIDEALLIPAVETINMETLSILGQPLVRAFAFGTVGYIVINLLEIQRAQRRVLLQANAEISHHAQTLEQLAVSRERNRLARELHDTLAHTLSGLSVNLEALKTTLDPSQNEIQDALENSLTVVRNGLNDTRRALKDLRPLALEELGLPLAIKNLSRAVADRANLHLQMKIPESIHLPLPVEQNVYRIVQEALENVATHASAENLFISLEQRDHRLSLVIEDDGIGFEESEIDRESKFGVKGMKERAEIIGGHLDISTKPQTGTRIELTVEIGHD